MQQRREKAKLNQVQPQSQRTYREIDRIKALQPEHHTLFENAKAVLRLVQISKKSHKVAPAPTSQPQRAEGASQRSEVTAFSPGDTAAAKRGIKPSPYSVEQVRR
jgi:Leucine-rich repeat (LRR) protein